jgi:N6-adenosine-specific RNA methylase IME4
MSLDDIKALPVEQLAADNCALFLWAVLPELPSALGRHPGLGFRVQDRRFRLGEE